MWHSPGALCQGAITGYDQSVGILQSFSFGIVSIMDEMCQLVTSVAVSGG